MSSNPPNKRLKASRSITPNSDASMEVTATVIRLRKRFPECTWEEITNKTNKQLRLKKDERLTVNAARLRYKRHGEMEGRVKERRSDTGGGGGGDVRVRGRDEGKKPKESAWREMSASVDPISRDSMEMEREEEVPETPQEAEGHMIDPPMALRSEDEGDVEDDIPLSTLARLDDMERLILRAVSKAKGEFWTKVAEMVNFSRDPNAEALSAREAMEWYDIIR